MSEFYFQAPTPGELSTSYKGMSFDEFKQLDDDAVDVLRLQERDEWFAACDKGPSIEASFDPEWIAAQDKVNTFSDFYEWRKCGVLDRDITEDEFLERMYFYADSYRSKDPNYGQLGPDDYSHLSEDEIELTNWALDEAYEDEYSFGGQPTISSGGSINHVVERLGVTLDDLVTKVVLETYYMPPSVLFSEGKGYVLAGKFAMHLFSMRYPEVASTESEHTEQETPKNDPASLEYLDELMAKMQTPEAIAAARSIFTATPEEISRGSATSRPQREQENS